MKKRPRLLVKSLCAAGLMGSVAVTHGNTLQLSQEGSGEALIFPYYTVRNGTVSFVSLVNQTVAGKALRLRVRESIGGRPVAEMNVFLSPKDVWTAAIVPAGEGAAIISNDKSCTFPAINGKSEGLAFSSAVFANDAVGLTTVTLDRVREGYLEIIEMATVPNEGLLGRDITHVAGTPACKLVADPVAVVAPATGAVPLKAPSGGLVGSMSFINLGDGVSVSYNATALNGFWKTGLNAPVPRIAPISAAQPDLTSGANATITVTDAGNTYVSTFARSIDAVSALFMATDISGEYAFTSDQVLTGAFVMNFPTKPYYVHAQDPRVALSPYQRAFDGRENIACDDAYFGSTDREEFVGVSSDDFGVRPPTPYIGPRWCGTTDILRFDIPLRPVSNPGGGILAPITQTPTSPGAFDSPRMQVVDPIQAAGATTVRLGKEGGWMQVYPSNPLAVLVSTNSSLVSRSASAGDVVVTPAVHTYFGLPVIGFALSVAKYQDGSPQQNFGNLNPLSTQRKIVAQ
jgi:hypothetical protein